MTGRHAVDSTHDPEGHVGFGTVPLKHFDSAERDDGILVLGERVHMVASDLDGTLLRRDGTLSTRTVSAVTSAAHAGADVVLVTGRPPRWVDAVAAQIPCHPVVICSNGALMYDARERTVIGEYPISPETALQVVDLLRAELSDAVFAVEAGFTYGQEPTYPNQWPLPHGSLVAGVETLVTLSVVKLVVRHKEPGDHWEVLDRARRSVGELAEVTSSGPGAPIELAAPGVTKASALAFLASVAGVEAREVLAFGDMPNDLTMLAWAGTSVAPANAHPEVLAAVDYVTTDCDQDGVALFLEGVLGPR